MTLRGCIDILKIPCDTNRAETYIPCPYCDTRKRKKRMNLNFAKDAYRCAKCGDKALLTMGGPLSFYMLMTGITDPKQAAKDYYSHMNGNSSKVFKKEYKKEEKEEFAEKAPAPVEVRDFTYTTLLSLLPLRKRHRDQLLKRGLTNKQIDEFCYRSTPSDSGETAKKLLLKGCTLEGVPGFYKDKNGLWTMKKTGSGILIPQRNSKGQIQGFQIRSDDKPKKCKYCTGFVNGHCDNEDSLHYESKVYSDDTCESFESSAAKYFALSSRYEDCGTAAKTYIHYREGQKGNNTVVITEGALKADIISSLSGYSVLSVPGVNSLSRLPAALKSLLAKDMMRVLIAYDMDIRENEQVKRAEKKLERLLEKLEIPYKAMSWDERYKGLDDYLWAKKQEAK